MAGKKTPRLYGPRHHPDGHCPSFGRKLLGQKQFGRGKVYGTTLTCECRRRWETNEGPRDGGRTRLLKLWRDHAETVAPQAWSDPADAIGLPAAPKPPAGTAVYRSDDRDVDGHDTELHVYQGGNGDWYLTIVNRGERIGPTVRVTTHGAPREQPQVCVAVKRLFDAMQGKDVFDVES